MSSLVEVEDVKIDPNGRFKYILIHLKHNNQEKFVVRGFKWAEYHGIYVKNYNFKRIIEIKTIYILILIKI